MMTTGMMAAVGAGLLAGMSGFHLWRAYEARRRAARHREAVSRAMGVGVRADARDGHAGGAGASSMGSSVHDAIVDFLRQVSRDVSLKRGFRLWRASKSSEGASAGRARAHGATTGVDGRRSSGDRSDRGSRGVATAAAAKQAWFDKNAPVAGLAGEVTAEGFAEARARLALLFGAIGFVVGLLFSAELAVVLALVGCYLGWRAPAQAIVGRTKWRAHETERHLPEMLNVVALGMRSGLSFDTSLKLYAEHFDTVLARELANAQQQWTSGLVRRDEALRTVAATYDSAIFARVVETIIRSIRYGSSMVQSLESDAAEARSSYQTERQERIAKAPVKMMIPTGVLILPAMLVLVMGPVLLELMGGGL